MKAEERRAQFKVKRTVLSKTIKQLKVNILNRKSRYSFPCELTLIKGFVSFTVPGATLSLPVESIGTAKANFSLISFTEIVNSFRDKILTIHILKDQLIVNTFSLVLKPLFLKMIKY